jgi:hypothetical protein
LANGFRAGILEGGVYADTVEGTPLGADISPLLANIFLHYVLDLWGSSGSGGMRPVSTVGSICHDYLLLFQRRQEGFSDDRRYTDGLRARHPEATSEERNLLMLAILRLYCCNDETLADPAASARASQRSHRHGVDHWSGSALAAMIVPAISLALLSLSAIVMLAAWRSPPNVGFDFGPSPSRIRSARSPRRKER